MKTCIKCGKEFPTTIEIDGIKRNLKTRTQCLDCLPFGIHPSIKNRTIKTYGRCAYCGKPLSVKGRKYCNNQCQQNYEYEDYIRRWKAGEETGTIGKNWIDVAGPVKRYIFEKYNHRCAECGWARINPFTKTLPLEIEHIDGDSTNNKEENLTLLCPNCHSLTKTYRGANKGHGTRDIKWVARAGSTNVN